MLHKILKLQTVVPIRHGALIDNYFDLAKDRRVSSIDYDDKANVVIFRPAREEHLSLIVPMDNVAGMVLEDTEALLGPKRAPKKRAKAEEPGLVPEEEFRRQENAMLYGDGAPKANKMMVEDAGPQK